MAQDAELKLKVSLDLAFFRQQLSTIGAQLGGQSVPIAIKFDKKAIADQYRLLDRYIRGKKFTVELNLVGGLTKDEFNKIKGRLDDLRELRKVEIPIGIKNGATGKNVDEVVASIKERLAKNQQIKQGGGKLRIETSVKPSITNEDIAVFKKAVKDKLSKIGALEIPTKLDAPKVEDLLKALQKNINRQKPLLVKTSIKPSILSADVKAFKKAVESKLSGITVKVKAELEGISKQPFSAGPTGLAGLQEYMRSQGMGPTGGAEVKRRAMFEDVVAGATFKELQRMTQQANIAGRSGLKTKAQMQEALLQINDAAMEGILGNLQMRMKDPLPMKRGFLDQIARAVFWMAGVDPEYLRQQAAQRRALPGVNFPATVPFRPVSIGPSSTGRALSAGAGPAGMIGAAQAPVGLLPSMSGRSQTQAIVEALIAQQGPRMLPPGGGALVDTKRIYAELQKNLDNALRRMFTVLEVSVFETGAGLKDGLDTFAYLAQALKDAEARTKQSRIAEEVDSLISRIETALRLAAARVNVRQVQIGIGASMQGALPSARVAGLLPAGVGREPSRYAMGGESREQMMARRTAEAYARSALRGVSVMSERQSALPGTTFMGDAFVSGGGRDRVTGSGQAPERGGALAFPGGAMGRATQLSSSYLALGKASVELKKFEGFFNTNKLPLAGAIEELAGEFGNATKQVLLYGTAYKALAFFMDLPNQALNAAKSLQTFNNQLNAITGSSENADRAFTFVDNLAARFNVPLESARQGFVKLYASMAPAGFSSGEIENLFTGISKASATLGLSADKVDRVTYAFSQMASKGQLMSEEVSGQLGDVIPGALSIMAEAARMDIATFKKAMEDGVFVGETFKQVMSNVPIVLENRFGKGAAGAAKTLQGSMNALAISTQKFYESFEPIVSMGAASIFPIIATAINDATQAVQAFTAAMQGNATPAQMLEGNAAQIYGILQQLREIFAAVASVIQGLTPTLMIVGKAFLTTAEYIAKLVNTPIGGFLADLAAKAGIALIAVQLFAKTGIVGLISQLILLQRSTAAAGGGLLTFASNLTKTATAAKFFRLAITGLIGAGILFGIEALVNAIGRMANRLSDARKNAIAARDAIKSMSAADLGEQVIVQQNKLQALSRAQKAGGKVGSTKDRQILEQMGMKVTPTGGTFIGGQLIGGQYAVDKNLIESFRIREQEQLKAIQDQRKSLYDTTPLPLNEVELGAGKEGDKGAEKALKAAEQAAKQEQQRRIELAGLQNDMDKIGFDYRMSLSDTQFEHEKRLIDELNNYELSGLNDMQARQLKFAQDLKRVKLDAEDAIRKAIQKTEAAQLNVVSAQRTAQAAGDGGGINSGPIIGGFTPAQLSSATVAASKFTGIANMCSESVKAFYKSLGISLPGVTAWADTVRNAGTTMKDWSKLAPGDIVATGKPGDTPHVGVYTGGQNVFHQSRSRGLRAGNYPDLDYFKQGGYFVRPNAGMKQSPASFSMETKAQKESFDLIKEQAKASAQTALQQLEIQNALKIAYVQTASTIKANIDSIFPVEKQMLDLSLQQMRHNLLMQGMPQEYIDYEEKRAAATEEAAMAVNVMKDSLSGAKAELKVYNDAVAGGTKLSVDQQANVTRLTGSIAALEEGLANAAKQQREYNIASLESAIATMKQADALKAMEEVSGRINDAVTGVTDTYKSLFKEIAMGEDSVEALKKAQQALADQFLTMVFDMAMKPVEESMKNSLAKMFGVPNEQERREESIKKMEEQLTQLKLIENNTAIAAGKAPASGAAPTPAVPGQMTTAGTSGGFLTGTAALQTLPFNGQTGGMLQNLPFPAGDTGFLSAIGINGEELSASISESANAYSEQLSKVDTSVFESANALGTAGTELGKEGAAGKKWHESLGQAVGGLGMAAGAVMGIVAGINQIKEGGTSNVLGGIGMIASMAGSLLGNFGGLFGGGGGASSIVQGTDIPIAQMPAGMQFANGGVAFGGFRAFANGGTVSGPTLGLVGEGKYNEAIVPLPDGRSIPVQLGGRSARDLMGNSAPGMPQAPSLSMKFETTKINGVEYVSREQLEQAMAETRRASIAGGAQRGMSMTLDKIKQSPSTRSSIGIR